MPLRSTLLALAVSLPLAAAAAPDAEAGPRSRALATAFTKVPAQAGPARTKAFADLDGYLALDELVAEAVAPRAAKFSAAELTRFKQTFREVLRLVAYDGAGDFFRKAAVTWGEPRVEGADTVVPAKVVVASEDLRTDLAFRWRRVGGALKVMDVAFEGDSLMKDYQAQFARIVDKSGPAGLQKAVDERRAALAKDGKK